MAERLLEKLDRIGAEAGIKQMTPEVYRFALDVRKDLVSEWPKRPWVGLTDDEIKAIVGPYGDTPIKGYTRKLFDQIEAKLKEKNFD
jgi:hypothetical protein